MLEVNYSPLVFVLQFMGEHFQIKVILCSVIFSTILVLIIVLPITISSMG